MTEKFDVLDEIGSVTKWLDEGRGVNVWRNHNLSSPQIGTLAFTPGDRPEKPHWVYVLEEGPIYDASRFLFYRKQGIVGRLFSSRSAGYTAACRAAEAAREEAEEEQGNPYEAPIGIVWRTWTVQLLRYQTGDMITGADGETRPLDTIEGHAVVEWVAIEVKA